MADNNIFLFVPNLIGENLDFLYARIESFKHILLSLQDTPVLFWGSDLCILCQRVMSSPLHFIFSVVSLTLLMGMPQEFLIKVWTAKCLLKNGCNSCLFLLGTKFGAMLDMLTDRCATMCLLATLGSFYPSYLFVFQLVMIVDVSCHWIHLHTSNVLGKTSHKNVGEEENALLRFYYTSRPFLFFMCAGNELFYSMLYLLHFTYGYTCKTIFFPHLNS
jgi:hypothetical protein